MTKLVKSTPRKTNLPEVIAEKIRRMIANGKLSPGVQLRQMDLAEEFGTSRVPIREALKRLTAESIVDHDQNRGFFVAKLSLDEAVQLYRIRFLLESEALSTIDWPDKEELARMKNLADELSALMKNKDSAGWLKVHREFSEHLFNLSPNKILVREILRFIKLTDRYRSWAPYAAETAVKRVSVERHLLKALEKKDREKLQDVFKKDRLLLEKSLFSDLKMRGL